MTLKLTVFEIERRANAVRAALAASAPKLIAFKNNYTPTENTVLADLVVCDFNGYAPQAIDFSGAATMAGAVASVTPPPLTWTKGVGGTGNNVYGYGVVDNAGTTLLWAERDPAAPLDMTIDNATYTVTARFTGTDV